ncbi:ANTAR domain-containing protein [Pedococcus sp. 5OH_020]|uniref:ANTAR domain-containing protein n=1 Tax=Pedococcus sp. 5OH_020 TaxID=2989814 RepID=UPI0022E9DA45|nr:ANTAR domain-containing protein [Pedococcus sp. 5OH_020]
MAVLFATMRPWRWDGSWRFVHLKTAVATRGSIGEAIGILMVQSGLHDDAAFQYLARAAWPWRRAPRAGV